MSMLCFGVGLCGVIWSELHCACSNSHARSVEGQSTGAAEPLSATSRSGAIRTACARWASPTTRTSLRSRRSAMLESCGRQSRYTSGLVMSTKMGMLWEPSKYLVVCDHLQVPAVMCEGYG